jgi:hypothetical protein
MRCERYWDRIVKTSEFIKFIDDETGKIGRWRSISLWSAVLAVMLVFFGVSVYDRQTVPLQPDYIILSLFATLPLLAFSLQHIKFSRALIGIAALGSVAVTLFWTDLSFKSVTASFYLPCFLYGSAIGVLFSGATTLLALRFGPLPTRKTYVLLASHSALMAILGVTLHCPSSAFGHVLTSHLSDAALTFVVSLAATYLSFFLFRSFSPTTKASI